MWRINSANIYKLYQAVGDHIAEHPDEKERFPNYSPNIPPVLALGSHGPLHGGRHFAKYFHGKWVMRFSMAFRTSTPAEMV